MHRLGRIPPAEYEANHYARIRDGQKASDRSAIADNVLAETVNGLYKTELIYGPEQKPWRTVADVELATLGWVHWFNNQRLHGYLDDAPRPNTKTSTMPKGTANCWLETNGNSLQQTQGASMPAEAPSLAPGCEQSLADSTRCLV